MSLTGLPVIDMASWALPLIGTAPLVTNQRSAQNSLADVLAKLSISLLLMELP